MINPLATHGARLRCLAHLLVLLSSIVLVGCTTGHAVRSYSGPTRQRSEVAYLTVDREFFGVQAIVRTLDGKSLGSELKYNNTKLIELTPGKHFLSVDFVSGNVRSIDPLYLNFEVKGGGTYALRASPVEQSFGDVMRVALGGRGHWTAWIVDVDTSKVIAGQQRQTSLKWYEK